MTHFAPSISTRCIGPALAIAALAGSLAAPIPATANPYTPVPLNAAVTNAPLGLYYPQLAQSGQQTLGEVPFVFSGTQRRLWASSPGSLTAGVEMEVSMPLAVHLLLNAFNAYDEYEATELGMVTLAFDDGVTETVALVAGRNVREWRPLEGDAQTVNDVADRRVAEVHRETLVSGAAARLDRLAVTVSVENRRRVLTRVSVTDATSAGGSPGFLFAGVTVERIPELITFVLDGEVFVSEVDGSNRRKLTEDCVECDHPSLSPNAREVVFVGRNAETGNLAIRTVPIVGGDSQVMHDLGSMTDVPRPLYTADGSEILFHQEYDGVGAKAGAHDLYSLDASGGGKPRRLTRTRLSSEASPAPAPSGTEIVYASRGRLYRLVDRRKRRTLMRRLRDIVDPSDPVFSRDGSRIIFRARRCKDPVQCPTGLFSVVGDASEPPQEIGPELSGVSSPALSLDGRRVMAVAPGGVWSLDTAEGGVSLLIERATANGSQAGDGLPLGCGPETTVVCYHPFRTLRGVTLRSGPSATAPAVVAGGVAVTVPAAVAFGAQSEPRVRSLGADGKLTACPSGAGAPPSAQVVGGYRWGYVSLPGTPANGAVGWIAESDLVTAPEVSGLCGPTGADYQCNLAPTACGASMCKQQRLTGFSFQRTGPSLVPCNTLETQPLNGAMPIYTPTREAFAPHGLLLAGSRVEAHFQTFDGEWSCVRVVRAKDGTVPVSTFGWIRTPFDYDTIDPYKLWCGARECGDGVRDQTSERTEECDDGNATSCDGCEPGTCKMTGGCGDGVFCPAFDSSAEFGTATCDDGNTNENDGCTSVCRAPFCGDRRRSGSEQCDDANVDTGDDCINCRDWFCGDGYWNRAREQCETNDQCPAGWTCSSCVCHSPPPTGACWWVCNNSTSWQTLGTWVQEWQCADAYLCSNGWGVKNRLWYPDGDANRRHCLKIGCYANSIGQCNWSSCTPGCSFCSN